MSKKIFIFILYIVLVMLTACSNDQENSIDETLEEKSIAYDIEQIVLSKGFQIIDTNVDVIERGNNLKLLITAGLIESSGIEIDKVTMEGNTLNFYLSKKMETDEVQLAVPQITLNINNPIKINPEDIDFNIIPQNYEPMSLKYNKSEILDKICTELKIKPINIPEVELYKTDDNIVWNIYFSYLLDKENSKSPLFSLNVKVDATTGEILDTEKHNISTYLDHGQLLDYMPNQFLIYKQEYVEDDIKYESLWSYDLIDGKRSKLYATKYTIKSVSLSPNGKYISLIEGDEAKSDIFLIERNEKIAFKINPVNYLHPKLTRWKDKDILYFIDVYENNTTLFLYNIAENTSNIVLHLEKAMESFDIYDDKFIFEEYDDYSINKNLYVVEEKDNLKLIGKGFAPIFFNHNYIVFLQNIEEENENVLKVYDIAQNIIINTLDYNILNYYKLDDENLLFVENLNLSNQFTFGKYNVYDNSATIISQISSNKLFYNLEDKKAYISLTIPEKEKNEYNIYSIDLTETYSNNNQ